MAKRGKSKSSKKNSAPFFANFWKKAKSVLKVFAVLGIIWALGALHIEGKTPLEHGDNLLGIRKLQPFYDNILGSIGFKRFEQRDGLQNIAGQTKDYRKKTSQPSQNHYKRKQDARKQSANSRNLPQGSSVLRSTHGTGESKAVPPKSTPSKKTGKSSVANSKANGIEFSTTPQPPLGDTSPDDNAALEAIIDQYAE